MKKIIYLFFILLILVSCTNLFRNKEVNVKYREKTPVEIIKIDSTQGNIDLIGWANDFVEINSKKILSSGFKQDLDLMDTVFEKNENELDIKTKIPARVDGKIHLKIFVPFVLLKLYINSKDGNININKYLGDIELANKNGNINILFQGSILRINSSKSNINLNIRSYNSTDIVINNEEAQTKLNIQNVEKQSYLDVKSLNGDVIVFISQALDHKLTLTSKDKKINLKYNIFDRVSSEGIYLSGKKGKNFNDFIIDILNDNGKINLSLANNQYFKKEISDMPVNIFP